MAHWLRSISAIAAGIITFAVSFGLGTWAVFLLPDLLEKGRLDTGLGARVVMAAYAFAVVAFVAPLAAGFVTARVARHAQMLHSFVVVIVAVLAFAAMDRFHQWAQDLRTLWIYWALGIVGTVLGTKFGMRSGRDRTQQLA